MTKPPLNEDALANASREDLQSALFATLVMQQASMALALLGKVPGPDGKNLPPDLDSAKMFIDQLEMLDTKTKGNLTGDESKLLQQNLTAIRIAFVETLEDQMHGSHAPVPPAPAEPEKQPAGQPPAQGEESRKRFTKSY